MDFPVVPGDDAGPGRLKGSDNQQGNPQPGDDAEDETWGRDAAGVHKRQIRRHCLGPETTRMDFLIV